ncbi:MAG TPA: hypothetical protein VHV74_06230 [Pseudonocardiaceae bacterium]|jgi:hypothetical protein|nr:hypothetical protein [Pseudonocardiaceae bacterium]
MTGPSALDRFLSPDPADSGCERAMALLHVYAELAGDDPAEAARRYPDVAAHIAQCGPCAEDLDGLLAAIHAMGDARA